jgi:hypothetical protein
MLTSSASTDNRKEDFVAHFCRCSKGGWTSVTPKMGRGSLGRNTASGMIELAELWEVDLAAIAAQRGIATTGKSQLLGKHK